MTFKQNQKDNYCTCSRTYIFWFSTPQYFSQVYASAYIRVGPQLKSDWSWSRKKILISSGQ